MTYKEKEIYVRKMSTVYFLSVVGKVFVKKSPKPELTVTIMAVVKLDGVAPLITDTPHSSFTTFSREKK